MTFSTAIKLFIGAFWCFIIVASIVSSSVATNMITNVGLILEMQKRYQLQFIFQNTLNENTAEKIVLTRNLFNVSGEIPVEDLENAKAQNDEKNFLNASCAPASEPFPVQLLGIIYTNNPKTSLVTVQDPDVEGADVYHEGDEILDYTGYSVYRVVNPTSVEFRYGSKKICRSLVSSLPDVVQNSGNGSTSSAENFADDPNTVELTHDYVEEELGSGLSKIVNSVRIAPSIVDGQIEGFKIFSITPGSLFEKIGLMNGDIVTEVNNQKLNDPAKGFVIYDAFQYDNKIAFTVKRGTERVIRKVIIK